MTLLFITHRINEDDDDLAFTIQWIEMFRRCGVKVVVICVEKKVFHNQFPVFYLGGAKGFRKILSALKFLLLMHKLKYDRVFLHMNSRWIALGGIYWQVQGIPVYLWYTHYAMHFYLWFAEKIVRRIFVATKQSIPMYEGNFKKIVTGHGIDTDFWFNYDSSIVRQDKRHLLCVNRISRSKRIEIAIEALACLPEYYTLTIYGRALDASDAKYFNELKDLVRAKNFQSRVFLKGSVPMAQLRTIYPRYSILINMAPETIDKTVVEAMSCGVFPITTKRNAEAIGIPDAPEKDAPREIARFIEDVDSYSEKRKRDLQEIVEKKHSLEKLIKKMLKYIEEGV
jgi:glycosyltransferase involved in cell wall biosynthesis